MKFSRWTFRLAAAYGLLTLAPLYFLEDRLNRDFPPAMTHPEQFYGFLGVALAWQVAFLFIAQDPARFRPIMIAAILEKLGYGLAIVALFAAGRIAPPVLATGLLDLGWCLLFVIAFVRTRPAVP